ncbi:nitrogen permease regulator of amino acid transport activity 3-domain-containing protein [Desarmillaria ectypa]|nr:nitrogen permease regulator of amino acid transport activity 3-domain-containing protein [Desarmillaria ectypa]
MADTLLAILLVTTSAKEANLVYQWPENPESLPRLSRPHPEHASSPIQLDNVWRASNYGDAAEPSDPRPHTQINESEYTWKRTQSARDRSISMTRSSSHSPSGRNSPIQDLDSTSAEDGYNALFGYSSSFLAGLLCPQRSMCHQKCELLVDDLAFIGHPVCDDTDGKWRFQPENYGVGARGRETRSPGSDAEEISDRVSEQNAPSNSTWLQTFNFVIVLDLPHPSSSASGNYLKYIEIVYEQIVFTMTAVLYQEQVLHNFVEEECGTLGSLKDSCMAKGEPFPNFMTQALEVSSIAPAMKTLYEAIKSPSMAYVTINNIPLELQLPPFLDQILYSEDDDLHQPEDEEWQSWGPEMALGWKLPALAPWKSLLLLDDSLNLRTPHVDGDDHNLIEGLVKFMEIASITLSLADMGTLLDWDLESQLFPTVRWLVQHRRAKVVDIVHTGLKTLFILPQKLPAPVWQLSEEFEREFSQQPVSSLPEILSAISTSSGTHFFDVVVQSKALIPSYQNVISWMLKRDLLVTLHLRVRIVATEELKLRVKHRIEKARAKKANKSRSKLFHEVDMDYSPPIASGMTWLSLSPKAAHAYSRRRASTESERSRVEADDQEEFEEEEQEWDSGWDTNDDDLTSSIIKDPSRATPLQRQWLSAMSEGKDALIAKRFDHINQYFDGKRTDDEILYRAEISRKQLRQLLHHYDEYLQTFLHPS